MNAVDEDIRCTSKILLSKAIEKYHDYIYFSSNEELRNILSNFDFDNKSVLSVLSSGDQAFHLYNCGVSQVDFFDINKLTMYYFYLRMWIIKYLGVFYPKKTMSDDYMMQLLSIVEYSSCDEAYALNYWKKYKDSFDSSIYSNLFIKNDKWFSNMMDKKSLDLLRDQINKREFDFYNIDISDDVSDIHKKYDVIYMSNILDYFAEAESKLIKSRDNLRSLLNDSGIVVCSNVTKIGPSGIEKRIFSENFEEVELPKSLLKTYGVVASCEYYYKKVN